MVGSWAAKAMAELARAVLREDREAKKKVADASARSRSAADSGAPFWDLRPLK